MTGHTLDWTTLGTADPTELHGTRLQLHHASQIVAAPGLTWAPAQPDWSHSSLSWLPTEDMLVGAPVGAQGWRAALRPGDFSLSVLDAGDISRGELELAGVTRDEGLAWLAERLQSASDGELSGELQLAEHELPEHGSADGEAFELSAPGDFAELSNWFGNAAAVLAELSTRAPGTPPVRCWPHHFDIAMLVLLDGDDADPERARSLNVGLSPGDGSYDQPYWYVTPWPAPEGVTPPALDGGGQWHTEGWFGAVLLGSDVVAAGDAAQQRALVDAFLASALALGQALLDA